MTFLGILKKSNLILFFAGIVDQFSVLRARKSRMMSSF